MAVVEETPSSALKILLHSGIRGCSMPCYPLWCSEYRTFTAQLKEHSSTWNLAKLPMQTNAAAAQREGQEGLEGVGRVASGGVGRFFSGFWFFVFLSLQGPLRLLALISLKSKQWTATQPLPAAAAAPFWHSHTLLSLLSRMSRLSRISSGVPLARCCLFPTVALNLSGSFSLRLGHALSLCVLHPGVG